MFVRPPTQQESAYVPFHRRGMAEREARRTAVYREAGWSVRVVTERDLGPERERTRDRLREAVTRPEQSTLW